MDLNDNQRKKLREDIENHFNEFSLQSLLLENENQFGKNLYNQISGASYRDRVIHTIRELNNLGLLELFIVAVRKEYPSFAKDLEKECLELQVYLGVEKKLAELMQLLHPDRFIQSIFGFENKEQFKKHLLDLARNDLENSSAWGLPKDLSLANFLSVEEFIKQNLEELLNPAIYSQDCYSHLQNWLAQNYPDLPIAPKNSSNINLQSYLLIIVCPQQGKTKATKYKTYNVRAELIEDFLKTSQPQPVELDTKNVKEEGYLEKEIPNLIPTLIDKAESQYLSSRVRNNQPYDLKIELFLPGNLLVKRLEFKTPLAWRQEQRTICEEYSIILRSLDRLSKTPWRNASLKKWRAIKSQPLQSEPLWKLDCRDEIQAYLSNPNQKKQLRLKLEAFSGLRMELCLKACDFEKLLQMALEKGIFLFFWLQQTEIYNLADLNELAALNCLGDPDSLCDRLFEVRKRDIARDDKEKYLGYNLSILYDNMERMPINIPGYNPLAS